MYTGFTFDQLRVALSNYKTGQHSIYPSDLYELFIKQYDKYLHGVSLSSSRNQDIVLDMLIKSASEYIIYGLIEKKDGLYIITELGKKFIAEYKHRITVRTR
ncbi:hypothetical protein NSU08_28625 [Paenibacillus sp. FSL H7-0331]|uniref:hypothetical protein n=1 Tax=Paenibacillus sp. FSL H7-0331 TaxID=1920421 RepID=UPI00096CA257|nr:hypothetical protein BK127_41200 [Paenibacillus sp. FSL H7-0331]